MSNPLDFSQCAGTGASQDLAPVDPYLALRYSFGMLLGVEDFETEQAYHRGKMRLHNAWLHREGVVWGYGVTVDPVAGEVQVAPGLALDVAGHELHLDGSSCLNLGAWYAANQSDPAVQAAVSPYGPSGSPVPGGVVLTAQVVVKFKACLSRAVPALLEPCAGAASDTAFSRVNETVELLLVPLANSSSGPVVPPRQTHYHRLRLLFGLDTVTMNGGVPAPTPAEQQVLDGLAQLQSLPREQQLAGLLDGFRHFAALDEIDMQPGQPGGPFVAADGTTTLFPGDDAAPLVLATIKGIYLKPDATGTTFVLDTANTAADPATAPSVDPSVRQVLVDTATIEELLVGAGARGTITNDTDVNDPPRVAAAPTFGTDGSGNTTVTLSFTQPLSTNTLVSPDTEQMPLAVSYRSSTDTTGTWQNMSIATVPAPAYNAAVQPVTVTWTLQGSIPTGSIVRVIARGTGPNPILGATPTSPANALPLPLAGAVGGASGSAFNGHDYVYMVRR